MNRSFGVVLTTNDPTRKQLLLDAISSLKRQTRPPEEIVVVIEPDLFDYLGPELTRDARVVKSNRRGLSASRNVGMEDLSTEICAFIDDDACADPGWLEALDSCYDNDAVVAAGGPVLPLFEKHPPLWYSDYLLWAVGCTYPGHRTTRGAVDRLIGCNMSFNRHALLMAGGFNESLGRRARSLISGEDTEACWRMLALKIGNQISFEPKAIVRHRIASHRMRIQYMLSRSYAGGRSLRVAHNRFPSRKLAAESNYARALLVGSHAPRGAPARLFLVLFSAAFALGFVSPVKASHWAVGQD
jgi:GT2 family glycosyltransferase